MSSVSVLLSVTEATVRYGVTPVFNRLTLFLREGESIALTGKNGAGKTTLMKLITGEREPEEGVREERAGLTIGYLPQEFSASADSEETVMAHVFAGLPDDLRTDERRYMAESVIAPLELNPSSRLRDLSGGQRRRASLAKALVADPDILLLDEPTNHLDLEGIQWLESYLQQRRGALLVVSHDRAFLAACTNRIFWLDRGQLRVSPKGFKYFDDWSAELLDQEARELRNRERALEIELEWASRGVKARRRRNEKRLADAYEERDALQRDMSQFKRATRELKIGDIVVEETSRQIAEFYRVDKSFQSHEGSEKKVLQKFSMKVARGDKIGLIGRNGLGKTTFLRLLTGEEAPDAGTVKRAKHLEFSIFEQDRASIKPGMTVRELLAPEGGDYINVLGKDRHICGYLKDFLFDPGVIDLPIETLSGGQKNRLMLARILAAPGGAMILDEPTNDLDSDTLDRLEQILGCYQGTLFVVSHDRDFLDNTVSKIIAFEGEGVVQVYTGGYSDYLATQERKRQEKLAVAAADRKAAMMRTSASANIATSAAVKNAALPSRRQSEPQVKFSFAMKHELKALPDRIKALEFEIQALDKSLADSGYYTRDPAGFDKTCVRRAEASAELDALETRWLELENLREAEAS